MQPVRFVTQFHSHFRQMEKILAKHCPILNEDPHLRSTLSDRPIVSNRRAKNLKAHIAPSKTSTKTLGARATPSLTFFHIKGMYQCKKARCLTCKHVTHRQKDFTCRGKQYILPHVPLNMWYTAWLAPAASFMLVVPSGPYTRGLVNTAILWRRVLTSIVSPDTLKSSTNSLLWDFEFGL